MKNKWFRIAFWLLIFAAWISMVSFATVARNSAYCKGLIVNVITDEAPLFVQENDVLEIVHHHYDSLEKILVEEINIDLLEESLEGQAFVANAEVYSSVNSELRVDVYQHKALLRVIHEKGSFYIDEEGKAMPLHSTVSARVPVVTGFLPDSAFGEAFELIELINEDEFLKAQITGMHRNRKGEFILYPRLGGHKIIFGQWDQEGEVKLKKLLTFYKEVIKKTGLDYYSQIDLRFEEQVVATKQ